MTIESHQVGTQAVVVLSGRMDAESAPVFEQDCRAWLDRGITGLIVDVGDLEYISSLGLRSFMAIGKALKDKGGDLRICRQKGLVKQVFEITRLNSIFPMHDSVEAALAAA